MKNTIKTFLITLLITYSTLAQVKLEIVKNAKTSYETKNKPAALSLDIYNNLQANLLTFKLNDSTLSFRMRNPGSKNYAIQVFEHINYQGQSALLPMPTGLLQGSFWDRKISSFKLFERQNSSQFGGSGGGWFNDPQPSPTTKIKTIHLWGGQYVDAIQIIWADKDGNLIPGVKHGGNGGGLVSLHLGFDEYITTVGGRAGAMVDFLFFRTNKGRVISAGGSGGGDFEVFYGNSGGFLSGISGSCGNLLDAISFQGYWDKPGTRIID